MPFPSLWAAIVKRSLHEVGRKPDSRSEYCQPHHCSKAYASPTGGGNGGGGKHNNVRIGGGGGKVGGCGIIAGFAKGSATAPCDEDEELPAATALGGFEAFDGCFFAAGLAKGCDLLFVGVSGAAPVVFEGG